MRAEAMDEQDFAASERAAGGGKQVAIGQMTPSQLLVKGVITHFEPGTSQGGGGVGFGGITIGLKGGTAEINTTMYIVDATTGQVMASKKCVGKVTKQGLALGVDKEGWTGDLGGFKKTNAGLAIEQAVDEGVKFMLEKLEDIPWSGEVVMVKDNMVYINRGEREGVAAGQTFVVGKATLLRDPATGEILDQSLEPAGTIQVIKAKPKLSICKIVQGTGLRKGMAVQQP